jgi:hypothetical protein
VQTLAVCSEPTSDTRGYPTMPSLALFMNPEDSRKHLLVNGSPLHAAGMALVGIRSDR